MLTSMVLSLKGSRRPPLSRKSVVRGLSTRTWALRFPRYSPRSSLLHFQLKCQGLDETPFSLSLSRTVRSGTAWRMGAKARSLVSPETIKCLMHFAYPILLVKEHEPMEPVDKGKGHPCPEFAQVCVLSVPASGEGDTHFLWFRLPFRRHGSFAGGLPFFDFPPCSMIFRPIFSSVSLSAGIGIEDTGPRRRLSQAEIGPVKKIILSNGIELYAFTAALGSLLNFAETGQFA